MLFYPAPAGDHSALITLLEALAPQVVQAVGQAFPPGTLMAPVRQAEAPAPPAAVRQRFLHETTEDEKFTGRLDMLERLDAWAADPAVRLVAISALGGLGKTALLGRWLRRGAHRRQGVFFWSFYRDNDIAEILKALKKFAQPGESLVIALDGLEVIQESPGATGYGKLLDPMLAELLHRHWRAPRPDHVPGARAALAAGR